ncbi:MAG: hypothetical protein INQ03_09560 [Candidatus Heimdallarchaeota archaeon]|nr:hypothetical protein [Candidatus Heimdallarchaeota archaeon]
MKNLVELAGHMDLFDALLGPQQSRNREILFDYDIGRDSRPYSMRPGREFYRVEITTRNAYGNFKKINWFYHSNEDRSQWNMTSLSMRGMGFNLLELQIIRQLKSLEYLDLQGNQLEYFSFTYLENSEKIHTLNLSSNNLHSVDIARICLPNLRLLSLFSNQIEYFDIKQLESCISLNRLLLADNAISDIDLRYLSRFEYLDTIDLGENNIRKISLSFNNPNLIQVLLNDNRISELTLDPELNIPNVSFINLSNNMLELLNFNFFLTLPSIRRLHLWGNLINRAELECTSTSLLDLNINSNNIEIFSLKGKYEHLEELEIAYNKIKNVDLSQNNLRSLKRLNISYNPLEQLLLPSFEVLQSLEEIDLLNTKLIRLQLSGFTDIYIKAVDRYQGIAYKEITINHNNIDCTLIIDDDVKIEVD